MSLPKINHISYKHKLVGLGKEVEYRAFTNREQKALLLAKQSGKEEEMLEAVIQVVQICTFNKVNVKALATFDIEDLFLHIRAKSVSEISNLRYEHRFDEDGKELSKFIDFQVNLEDVKINTNPKHNKKIMLDDNLGIIMKYPTYEMANISDDDLPMYCIDTIFTKDETYNPAEYSKEDLQSFFDDIGLKGMLKIKEFFDTMPVLEHTVKIKLPDNTEKEIVLKGLQSFF